MNSLPAFIPEPLIKAIGWTLLHSLWQGAGIALVLAVLLVILHRRSAAIRYTVSAVAMLILLLFIGNTFISQYKTFTTKQSATPAFSKINAGGFPVDLAISHADNSVQDFWFSIPDYLFIDYFSQHLPLLVLLWMIGIAVLLLKFMGGLAYTQRLKNYKTTPLPDIWQERIQFLAQQLQISQKVQLVESALVKIPMVIGHFKPVILLPVGVVTGLPIQQIEAILAHELAHIYRKDYLFNLVQSLMEIVFFYHPCVWWISARIREERENCCDDIALSVCADSLTFAKALTNLQFIKEPPHRLAIAFTGKRSTLLYRIERLMNTSRSKPNFGEGFIAALFLMLSLLAVSVSASSPFYRDSETVSDIYSNASLSVPDQQTGSNQMRPDALHEGDSIRAKDKRTITFNGIRNNNNYDVKIILVADTVHELYIDGQQIPASKIREYRDLIDELTSDLITPLEPAEPMEPKEPSEPEEPAEILEEAEPAEPLEPKEIEHPEPVPPIEPEPAEPADYENSVYWGDSTKQQGKTTISFTETRNGKKLNYKIRMEDGVVKELYVDGKKIPADKIPTYSNLIDEYIKAAEDGHMHTKLSQEEARIQQEDLKMMQEEISKRIIKENELLRKERERELEREKRMEEEVVREKMLEESVQQ